MISSRRPISRDGVKGIAHRSPSQGGAQNENGRDEPGHPACLKSDSRLRPRARSPRGPSAYRRRSCSLLAFGQDAECRRRPSTEIWTNTSLPPSSLATKPKPLASSNHLTLPLTVTALDGSGAMRARRARATSPGERTLRARLHDAGRVDFDHARDLRALGAGADDHAQLGARGNRLMAGRVQRVGVQERVALAAGQFDEAVALVGLEPFDHGVDRRSATGADGEKPGRRPSAAPPKRCRGRRRRRANCAALGS